MKQLTKKEVKEINAVINPAYVLSKYLSIVEKTNVVTETTIHADGTSSDTIREPLHKDQLVALEFLAKYVGIDKPTKLDVTSHSQSDTITSQILAQLLNDNTPIAAENI
jgi:hypothetical protein